MIGLLLDGKYHITRLLGGGGMGVVYEAQDAATGRRVAVKVITTEVAKNELVISRFQREAKASCAVDTPHIVKVFEAEKDRASGLPYMVMELLDGEDIDHLVERLGPLPPDLALRITAQACVGLQMAHEAGVIHRDIKPANLFLARQEGGGCILKLLDFGIAKVKPDKAKQAHATKLTSTGSMLGSPIYMAPEQARGSKHVDTPADIWSLGVVLYQALTGRTPFQEIDALGELIIAICSDPPPPVQDFAPWVPPEVAAIVHAAMRLDPAERYPSAAAMRAAIEALLPEGSAIDDAMVRPLSADERAKVSPRLPLSAYGTWTPPARSSRISGGGAVSSPEFDNAVTLHAGTTAGVSSQPRVPVTRAPVASRFAAIAVAAAVATGLLAYQLVPSPGAPQQATAALAASELRFPSGASSAEPAPRTVTLLVTPRDASVEVDGARVTPSDGAVSVTGSLGSVHRVRVFMDGREDTEEVSITVNGALPARIDLDVPQIAAASPRKLAKPAGSATSNAIAAAGKTGDKPMPATGSPGGPGAVAGAAAAGAASKRAPDPLTASTKVSAPASATALDTKFE